MKDSWKFISNPFYKVAGYKADGWGILGIVITTVIAYGADVHFHGLLHYGGAPHSEWWCFVVEHLVIWLIPSLLVYILSLFCSRSHVRPIDVLGTVAFSQLPFVLLALCMTFPPVRHFMSIQSLQAIEDALSDKMFLFSAIWIGALSLLVAIWVLYWIFRAISVSCNLRGRNLWIVFIVGTFGGDILCRYLIGLCY